MLENAFINVKGAHHTITAEVELKDDRTNGVILAQAGYRLAATHDFLPRQRFMVFEGAAPRQ